jgi:hypothetical protein
VAPDPHHEVGEGEAEGPRDGAVFGHVEAAVQGDEGSGRPRRAASCAWVIRQAWRASIRQTTKAA